MTINAQCLFHKLNKLLIIIFSLLNISINTVQGSSYKITSGLSIPVSFEQNQGQFDEQVKFLARVKDGVILLTTNSVIIHFPGLEKPVRMEFVGSNVIPEIKGEKQLVTRSNYLIGNSPDSWQSNVTHFGQVRYQELYNGVDVVFYSRNGKLEYDFIISPAANPDQISVKITDVNGTTLNRNNDLVLYTDEGNITQSIPDVYQLIDGQRVMVDARQVLDENNILYFEIPKYKQAHALIIDPVLSFSRFFGGSGDEEIISLTTDRDENIYLVGGTSSPNMPISNNSLTYPEDMFNVDGNRLAFVAKLDPSGTRIVYMTYLGGSKTATAHYVRVDREGNAYLAGRTEADDFPTMNPIQSRYGGGSDDVFLSKLNSNGSALIYSTYIGGSEYDQARSLALDDSGSVYLTGRTESDNYPVFNPFIADFGGNQDGFVTKVSPDGSRLVYSSYLGGSQNDIGHAITVDTDGNAYITGLSNSPDFPTVNAYQDTFSGGDGDDTIVVKVSADGSRLLYSTFIGGTGDDESRAIAVDDSGNAIITGYTRSTDFPIVYALQDEHGGDTHDIFVSSLTPDGSGLRFSTYIGGSGRDYGRGLALDSSDNIYLTGYTTSLDFRLHEPIQERYAGGSADAFVIKLDPMARDLLYSSYLGGSEYERGRAVTVDNSGNILVSGRTESADFTLTSPVFGGGTDDAFVIKISPQ